MISAERLTLALAALLLFSPLTRASLVSVATASWTSTYAPSAKRNGVDYWSENDYWTGLAQNTPTKTSNSSGSLVSDFVLGGNFSFSGNFRPTYANNNGCIGSNDNSCNDNDILGLVFGWQDQNNHYRLGWSQGGLSDITGRTGLFLIREVNGVSNTLLAWENLFWQDDVLYNFTIRRLGEEVSVMLRGASARNTVGTQSANTREGDPQLTNWSGVDFSLIDTRFLAGRVGVYTESQTAVFSSLQVEGRVIPLPATFSLVGLGLLLLGYQILTGSKKFPNTR